MFTVKKINLNAKVSAKKATMGSYFKICGKGICTAMGLMNQDIIVVFQIIVLLFKI